MNEPRYPTLRGIMGAKKKEVKELKAADLQAAGFVGFQGPEEFDP
jgi:electron transfer flavoprotein alpha/beta subunit